MTIQLCDKELCTGCSACYDICPNKSIEMLKNDEGFLYPSIKFDSCISCGKCQEICPIINFEENTQNNFKEAYLAWCLNDEKRINSTSGGVFRVFSEASLEENRLVVGAGFDEIFNLKHTIAENPDECKIFYGSKYLQSDMRGIYKAVQEKLQNGNSVMFSGLPCQIDAIKRFLPNDLNTKLITCELLCHGVPSPGIFSDYVKYLENKFNRKLIHYNFRSKINGWNKMSVELTFAGKKKKSYKAKYCPYHTWFGLHISLRESCYYCKYRSRNRNADITIGDFWGIEKLISNVDVSKGVSLIYTNNEKGKDFLEKCSDKLFLKEIDVEKSLVGRKIVLNNFELPVLRKDFMEDYKNIPMKKLIKKYPASTLLKYIILRLKIMLKK
ncbi:MAG: Coenzyme F420 hydrogenase/dehydrogenase, beta subunit C-terminal domain [Candidatus Delongbacteria bacterium]|nr:Coenzyme F420 hydrogenase/dehydrogenase, beta subunit C-terminal domain [Candidatus Delongbacteria bacterium]